MANAARDENGVTTLLGALSTDGVTPTLVKVNPANNALKVDNNTIGSDFGLNYAERDQNFVTVLLGVSSADGVTPVEVYANSSGALLIDSN